MSDPYITLKPGDIIRADDWNAIQTHLRDELRSHTHGGADQGTKIKGDSIDAGADLSVHRVSASELVSAPKITGGALEGSSLAITGAAKVSGSLDVGGPLGCKGVTQQIQAKSWTGAMADGKATDWGSLPVDMSLSVATGASMLFVQASLSRCQHSATKVNTEYRITVDDVEIAKTNTGNHDGWNYKAISLHGVYKVAAGTHVVRVQYKTQSGAEKWLDNADGFQDRRLTALEIKD